MIGDAAVPVAVRAEVMVYVFVDSQVIVVPATVSVNVSIVQPLVPLKVIPALTMFIVAKVILLAFTVTIALFPILSVELPAVSVPETVRVFVK